MSYLAVTNFRKFQHYKNRKPPWIKFYVDLLDPHHPINQLPIPTRYLFDRLLLLAAEWNNAIPNSPEFIATHVSMPNEDCRQALAQLMKGRWIKETTSTRRASKAAGKNAPPETETELEIETPLPPLSDEVKNGNITAAKELQKLLIEKVSL